MYDAARRSGAMHGYAETEVFAPAVVKAREVIEKGGVGRVLWVRSRESHSGPHSPHFWDVRQTAVGALNDLGCHTIETGRSFVGKDVRPVEVVCWGATQVHPIEAEDSAVGLVRYANGALAQFEAAWTFRGGMDLRDEVSGSDGTIWLNHWLRTGFEMFSAPGSGGYVAEKAETESGWLFPVGDEVSALGYDAMFADMLDAFEQKRAPVETFYDGYVVNAIMDACYRSMETKRWEPVVLDDWRGATEAQSEGVRVEYDARHWLIKLERMPDGRRKLILKDKQTGAVSQREE